MLCWKYYDIANSVPRDCQIAYLEKELSDIKVDYTKKKRTVRS